MKLIWGLQSWTLLRTWLSLLRTKFSNVGRFHDPRICQLYYVGPFKQGKNSCLLFIHSYWHLELWVELYTWHYSQESLFIPGLFIEYTIHSINIIEHNDIPYWHHSYFIPMSISSHFLSFFPWRYGSGRPYHMLNIWMEHNHVGEEGCA